MYSVAVILQMRSLVGFFQSSDIMTFADPKNTIYLTLLLFLSILMNQTMLSHIFPSYKNLMNVSTILVLNIGLIHRIWGITNIMPSIVKICINLFVSVLMMPLYIYVQQALMNLNTEMSNDASKVIQEVKVVNALQYEYQ